MLKHRSFLVFILSIFLMLSVVGCTNKNDVSNNNTAGENLAAPPVYSRSTSEFYMKDGANPYKMAFSEYGFAYYVNEVVEDNDRYDIYYQSFEVSEPVCIGSVEDGYIGDIYLAHKDGSAGIYVFSKGEKAILTEYNPKGKIINETVLDESANEQVLSKILVTPEGSIIVGTEKEVMFLDQTGTVTGNIQIDGYLRSLFFSDNGKLCGIIEKNDSGKVQTEYCELKSDIFAENLIYTLPDINSDVWTFDSGIAYVKGSYIAASYQENGVVNIVDLDKQQLFGSQIKYIFGTKDEIKLVSMDESDPEGKVYLYTLSEKPEVAETGETKADDAYTEDGRKIVKVVIPKDCIFQVDYHAKKYNQVNDKVFVEIEELSEPLEDYLGKGNRPDVIMFEDNTEAQDYVNKGLLEDILPLISEDDKYLIDDILPKAKELCCLNGKMYSLGGLFWMMCNVSNGQENKEGDFCNTTEYLKWYDAFLTERGINGKGRIENLLYTSVSDFYDEESGKASFESDEFKKLINTYKEVCNNHEGNISQQEITELYDFTTYMIASGPRRYISYGSGLFDTSLSLEGIPCIDGTRKVYMKINYPMAILNTSNRKEEAADFILYFASIKEYLQKGYNEKDLTQSPYTMGLLSVFKENLDYEILKTEKPYTSAAVMFEDGVERRQEWYFTQEHCDHLLELIEQAVPDSKEHIMIFNMMIEEMDGFVNGNKDLDECCKILQSRAELYLSEQIH